MIYRTIPLVCTHAVIITLQWRVVRFGLPKLYLGASVLADDSISKLVQNRGRRCLQSWRPTRDYMNAISIPYKTLPLVFLS